MEFPFADFDGTPRKRDWRPPPVEVSGISKKPKDFVSFRLTIPCVSARAAEALAPLIEPYCEILEFAHYKKWTYYVFNVTEVVDCVDWEMSDYHRSKGSGVITNIWRCQFDPPKIPQSPIFKVLPRGEVYVQQSFVDIVLENILTNVMFTDPNVVQLPLALRGLDRNVVPYVAL